MSKPKELHVVIKNGKITKSKPGEKGSIHLIDAKAYALLGVELTSLKSQHETARTKLEQENNQLREKLKSMAQRSR